MSHVQGSVMIFAGGTGGHIYPGLAVAEALRQRGVGVHWLGARDGMEARTVPAHGIEIDLVRIGGVRGKGLAGWLSLPFKLLRAVLDARACLKRVQPRCAVSFGGFAAGPGGLAAWTRGVPLLVHEQNRLPGLTNRILARLARRVLQAFPDTFPGRLEPVTCGNPVRSSIATLPEPAARFFQRSGRPRLLVTGGSQGAGSLNRTVPEALARLPAELRPHVCHQSGRGQAEQTAERYQAAGLEAEVSEFIENMAGAYAWADIVVCRSGALTVSELAAAGVGSILVPFPHAVDDHQAYNAGFLVDSGAALMLREAQMSSESLAALLEPRLGDRAELLKMAEAARSLGVQDSAGRVADACAEWVGQ
ncbi:MAG: undecaprenyldiphospho-muramoylpentapeptide beta-N-acetylglucosaminyltransferase [Xanthomonadales bacterium]|nr:undecaprenyldiphospho-muramoylpentapeptide beta-N-acetylglucosaminyltransferase [Xanthomonadales bacterium]